MSKQASSLMVTLVPHISWLSFNIPLNDVPLLLAENALWKEKAKQYFFEKTPLLFQSFNLTMKKIRLQMLF